MEEGERGSRPLESLPHPGQRGHVPGSAGEMGARGGDTRASTSGWQAGIRATLHTGLQALTPAGPTAAPGVPGLRQPAQQLGGEQGRRMGCICASQAGLQGDILEMSKRRSERAKVEPQTPQLTSLTKSLSPARALPCWLFLKDGEKYPTRWLLNSGLVLRHCVYPLLRPWH